MLRLGLRGLSFDSTGHFGSPLIGRVLGTWGLVMDLSGFSMMCRKMLLLVLGLVEVVLFLMVIAEETSPMFDHGKVD